jgi:hypothetical protein
MSTASVKAAQTFADAIARDEFLRDANVDLRGFPNMNSVEDTSFIDDRFAPMDVSGSGQGSKECWQELKLAREEVAQSSSKASTIAMRILGYTPAAVEDL